MSKAVRGVSLASFLLLLCAVGSCHVGERQWGHELRQIEGQMKASGLYLSHSSPDTNLWQVIGFLLFFAGVSVGIAAFLLWRQDRKRSAD